MADALRSSVAAHAVLGVVPTDRRVLANEEEKMKLFDGGIVLLVIFVAAAAALFVASQVAG
jgi:hypothetical protein